MVAYSYVNKLICVNIFLCNKLVLLCGCRLVIPMMLVILVYSCLYKYLVSGPMIPPQITDAENCKTAWWQNILMLHNLIDTDNMVSESQLLISEGQLIQMKVKSWNVKFNSWQVKVNSCKWRSIYISKGQFIISEGQLM